MPSKSNLKPLGALMAGLVICSGTGALAETRATDPKTEAGTLPAVEVKAARDEPAYMATKTRVGKIVQDPHDVPQALTTVTSSLLQEQQASSLQEALRNVSGISFNAAEGGRAGDNMNLRGFYTFGDMYLDGIRDTAQYNRETFNLEQIDVLRGAGAMLFGRGQAGGVINQVSKTPLDFDQYKASMSVGSHGYSQQTFDLNKSINDNTGLRVNLMNRDDGSWRSNPANGAEPDIHRQGLALSLALNQQSDNKFWINHYTLKTRDNPDYGIRFDPATRAPTSVFPSNYFWGTPKTFDNSDTSMTTLVHELRLSSDSTLRTQLRYADYQRSYWASEPQTSAPDIDGMRGNNNKTRMAGYKTTTLQSDYSNKFNALGMKHAVVTGIEYLSEEGSRRALQDFGTGAATGNVNSTPIYYPYVGNATPSTFKSDSYAIYAQDTVEFMPKWKATLGARRDQMNAVYSSTTSPKLKFGEMSYRTALSFHPREDSHYYLAYSDSFSPTADLYQLTTVAQPAERSDIIELGAKWLLADGNLSLRAALYSATKHWERNADLESTASILTKKRRTNGFELEAAGRITSNWEVFSGLALMDARILEVAENINATTGGVTTGNAGYVGQRARNTPKYTFNLWSTYKLDSNWKIGGGVEAKGDRQALNPSSSAAVPTLNGAYHPNTAPSYHRWDAMVAYEKNAWAVKLNLKNVFDKLYYDAVYDNGGFTIPGARRTLILTAELKY